MTFYDLPIAFQIIFGIVHHTLTNMDTAPWWFWAFTLAVTVLPIILIMTVTYERLQRTR